jgi:HK97 family phage prohead protease
MEDKILMYGEVKSLDGKITVIASDFSVDRHGEKVNPDGWLLKQFKKNPVMLIGHDYSSLPVGKWKNIKVEGGQLVAEAVFASTEKAKEVESLVRDEILNAVSVGFIAKKRNEKDFTVIDEAELLEISWVSVPANPNALRRALAKGYSLSMFKSEEQKQDEQKQEALMAHYKEVIPEYRKLLKTLQEKNGITIEGEQVAETDQIQQVAELVTQPVEAPEVTTDEPVADPKDQEVETPQPSENPINPEEVKTVIRDEVQKLLSKYL